MIKQNQCGLSASHFNDTDFVLLMMLIPGCVAGVCQGEVADPQLVHGAQGTQAAINGVASLHPNQAGCFIFLEGVHDACACGTGGAAKQA